MIIAEIIPISSSLLTESLSYFSANNLEKGTLVTIPLRKKKIKGIVVSTSDVKNIKQNLRHQNFKIRNILEVHNETIFSPAYLSTVEMMKNYYLISTGRCISLTYPKYILDNLPLFIEEKKKEKQKKSLKKRETVLIQKKYEQRISLYEKMFQGRLEKQESVHVICPTQKEVEKIEKDLKKIFPNEIISLHGKTRKKNLEQRIAQLKNNASILVSTPHFIDMPILKRTLMVMEFDSSPYYYKVTHPKIDMRIFIDTYAKNAGIACIYADSVLRPSRFKGKDISHLKFVEKKIFEQEKIQLISAILKKALKQSDEERIEEIHKKRAEFSPFSDELLKYIKKSIEKKEKIFFYTTRKSLAPSIMCRDCGKLVQDRETGTPYSLFLKNKNDFFYMNRTNGKVIPAFDTCQFCGSWRLQTLGIGTEQIQRALKKLFPDEESIIIDSEHTKNKSAIKKSIKKIENEKSNKNIIIGTQLAVPYLSKIDRSFVVSIDGVFYRQGYHNEMHLLLLLKRIYDFSKKTYVQTRSAPRKRAQKKEKAPQKNENFTSLSESLHTKFSQQLQNIIKKIQYTENFSKNFKSRYTEALKIWELIQSGDYQTFLESQRKQKKHRILKISHQAKKDNYIKIYEFYKSYLKNYQHNIKIQKTQNRSYLQIIVILFLDEKKWTIDYQDEYIQSLIDRENRNISIEIDPETF